MPAFGWLLLLLCASAVAQPAPLSWRVGAGSATIDPPVGTLLAGYDRNRRSTGTLDTLKVRSVVIDDARKPIALVVLDNIGLTRPDVMVIQRRVHARIPALDPDRVIVSSTHTHAGPDVVGLWGENLWSSGRDENHVGQLIDRAVETVEGAWRVRVPARLRAASREVPMDWVVNVSEPGLLDRRMTVLQFTDRNGVSIATLTNYACHPTVLGPDNTLTSADYVYGFVNGMAQALPGEHLFLQGAIGGWVQPLQGNRSHTLATALGEQLAEGALGLLAHAGDIEAAPIRFASSDVGVPLANWGFRLFSWLGILQREIPDGVMTTTVARFELGSVAFVTHPGETSPAWSLESRRITGADHTVVMGLTQDAMGYILKPDYFERPDHYAEAEYLTSVSVGPEAGPVIMATLRALQPE